MSEQITSAIISSVVSPEGKISENLIAVIPPFPARVIDGYRITIPTTYRRILGINIKDTVFVAIKKAKIK